MISSSARGPADAGRVGPVSRRAARVDEEALSQRPLPEDVEELLAGDLVGESLENAAHLGVTGSCGT